MLNSTTNNTRKHTNWYVITGGPSSGKTTTVNILAARGYKTTIEHARHYLDTKRREGKMVQEIRRDQMIFQQEVLNMQIEQEDELFPEDIVFLDRAIPDALAYYRFLNLPVDEKLLVALSSVSYKKVFILDYFPLVKDYARNENEEDQIVIHALITEVYESLPFPVIHVPVKPPEERVDLLLSYI